jgi:hypothetical protein
VSRRAIELLLWSATALGMAIAGWSVVRVARPGESDQSTDAPLPRLERLPTDSVSVWAQAAASRNPFRFHRSPAAVRFGTLSAPVVEPERPGLPTLALLGTIGGPPWQGVVAGFPGQSTSLVVRSGQQVDGFRVRAITRDSAVITGMDTTWNLVVSRPWR